MKEMETLDGETGDVDRISQLPESIVRRILSSLVPSRGPPIDFVRMSVLSKKWFDLTDSFPVLYFFIGYFRSRESFFKYVENATSRFCQKNVTARKLTLDITLWKHVEIDTVNNCVELVLQNGVREMEIYVSCSDRSPMPKYRLPDLLLSVSVLESLTIRACELPSSLMAGAVKLNSLIRLTLENVKLDDEGIKHLITGCPLLQELLILLCYGFKSFCVYGHQNLKRLSFHSQPFERVEVVAPNLTEFWMADLCGRGTLQMNLASCEKLTTVTYHGHPLVYDILSKFPFVEFLHFITRYECNNLKWSSHSLRTLVLECNCALEEIELNTPNLVFFIYGSLSCMMTDESWSLVRDSTHLKACMQCYPGGSIDALWFQKLRLFLDKNNGFKVSNLDIHLFEEFIELEELNEIDLPPYELEHVELQLETYGALLTHMAFVDAVLWFFNPRSLTLRSSYPSSDFEDVVKLICDMLLEQEDKGHTNIQIVSCEEGNAVSFIKKEVVQEEAG